MNIVQYNGKHYIFYNTCNESEEMFQQRTWLIVKNIYKYNNALEYLENLSFAWVNNKFLGVTYDEKIMKEISGLLSIYDDIK